MGDFWRDVKPELEKRSRAKRASNRKNGERALLENGLPFLKKNDGAHLIVNPEHPSKRADFWPGTGLWRSYWGSHKGRGLASLFAWLNKPSSQAGFPKVKW